MVGEVGWPGPLIGATEQAQWNTLADSWYRHADALKAGALAWSSGEGWGPSYNIGQYVNGGTGQPVNTANPNTAPFAAHPSGTGYVRGVGLAGMEFGVNSNRDLGTRIVHSQSSLNYLYTQGVRTVRLAFAWEAIQQDLNATLDATELGYLNTVIQRAATAGITVILDCHSYARYKDASGGATVEKVMTTTAGGGALNASHLADLWAKLSTWVKADATRNATVIGYGLMNEPHDLTAEGGVAAPQVWESCAQTALTAIRGNADTRTVYVASYQYSTLRDVAGYHPTWTITDSAINYVVELHQYWDHFNGGTYPSSYSQYNGEAPW